MVVCHLQFTRAIRKKARLQAILLELVQEGAPHVMSEL